MSKYLFYLYFVQLIVINVESDSIFDALQGNSISTALQGNPITAALQGNSISTALQGNSISAALQGNSISSALQGNSISTALQGNKITATLQDNVTNNSITTLIKNGVALNCFGIPVDLFANIIESIFTQTTKAENIRFYFYSRDRKQPVTVLAKTKSFDLAKINFSTNRQTVIITHGFMSSGTQEWVKNMANAFLQMEDSNVIVVDWEQGSNTWNYVEASISARIVGSQIALLLYRIKQRARVARTPAKNFGNLHCVGHSLGSHICAHASYQIQQLEKSDSLKWTFQRISGLDPAQPCFNTADPTLKLDKTDALYVDVIHTNTRHVLFMGLGLPDQLGHDDFYPNGGQIQLGCDETNPSIWSSLMLPANIIKRATCSHGRSYELFTDSILVKLSGVCTYQGRPWNRKYENLKALLKEKCDAVCPELGINSINYRTLDKNGTYFVPTGDKPPFCEISKEHRSAIEKQLRRDQLANSGSLTGLVVDRLFG